MSFGYLSFTTMAMSFGLLCITISTFCQMFGPGLALRGKDGPESVHKAVDNMKNESKICFKFFIAQLLCFHCSSFLLMWLFYTTMTAIVTNIVLMIFLVAFVKTGYEIFEELYIEDEEAVTGKYKNFDFQNINDLDGSPMKQSESYWEQKRRNRGSDDIIPRNSVGRERLVSNA